MLESPRYFRWPHRAAGYAVPCSDTIFMIEEYTVRFLDMLRPAIATVPPPVYLGVLLGLINSCIFYVILGRGFKLFLPYLLLGSAAAAGGAMISGQLPETGPLIGDVSIAAASISTWTILFIARSMRL